MSGNQLRQPVDELLSLAFLKKLTLSYNDLSDVWPLPPQLETLVVSHNKLSGLGENIPRLIGLKALDISYNKVSGRFGGIQGLAKLQSLNVSNNEVGFDHHELWDRYRNWTILTT